MFVDFPEVVIIFGVALVVLGPKKLPGTAAQVGRWVGRARAMARQFRDQLEQEVGAVESALDVNAKPSPSRKPAAQSQPDDDAQGGAGVAEHSAAARETDEAASDLAWHPEYGTSASDAPYGDPHLAPYGDPSLAPYGDPAAVPPSGRAAEGQLPLELDTPAESPASVARAAPARTHAATPEPADGSPEGR